MHNYRVTLEKIEDGKAANAVEVNFENHDDVFKIIEFMKASGHFASDSEAAQFGVGLKMFSAIMMKNRGNALFKDFEPAFRDFMMKLKGKK